MSNLSMSNQTVVENWLKSQLAEQLSLDADSINVSEPLTRYGLDSIDAVTMVGDIEDVIDEELPSTLFWDYPTIAKSAQFLADNYDVSALGKTTSEPIEELEDTAIATATPAKTKSKGWGGLFGRGA
ncbi:MAG: acyl carrier protein [Xenococcaceae cyanobacterium MO_207.B15]|nr:acyl carrier protein [Xenococcaceae cyanobacterium MO_207.B15]MDJ0745188.1 acyl carrier protein [Xenococcaceae cyanobacterium MO_167.B27]